LNRQFSVRITDEGTRGGGSPSPPRQFRSWSGAVRGQFAGSFGRWSSGRPRRSIGRTRSPGLSHCAWTRYSRASERLEEQNHQVPCGSWPPCFRAPCRQQIGRVLPPAQRQTITSARPVPSATTRSRRSRVGSARGFSPRARAMASGSFPRLWRVDGRATVRAVRTTRRTHPARGCWEDCAAEAPHRRSPSAADRSSCLAVVPMALARAIAASSGQAPDLAFRSPKVGLHAQDRGRQAPPRPSGPPTSLLACHRTISPSWRVKVTAGSIIQCGGRSSA
jgi:hypothetical protein